jgi:chromosome partition protein MukF
VLSFLYNAELGGITQEVREFTLSDFGAALATTIYQEHRLDSEGLKILMGTLCTDFAQILKQVEGGGNDEHWRQKLVIPLQQKTRALIERVDQRQRAMDKEQAELRIQVQTMLDQSWFEAIEACEILLSETSSTLGELNRILGEEVDQAMVLLGHGFLSMLQTG